jgi:hypothetical protein
MNGAFGNRDWISAGVLFAGCHRHETWVAIPTVLVDTFVEAGASNRYRSAWVGDAVHSAQTVLFALSWSYSFSSSRRKSQSWSVRPGFGREP